MNATNSSRSRNRGLSSSILAGNGLNIVYECIAAALPVGCSKEESIRKTLEFVCNLDCLVRNERALSSFFSTVVASKLDFPDESTGARLSDRGLCANLILPQQGEARGSADNDSSEKSSDTKSKKGDAARREETELFLSNRALARRWGVSTVSLGRWRRDGRLRAHYFGRYVRFKITDIIEFER